MATGMNRRELLAALAGATALPAAARAQPETMKTIGVLAFGNEAGARDNMVMVQRRLAEMGHVEGRNLKIEYRAAGNQESRLAALAGELLQLRVAAITVHSGPGIVAAKAATTSVPIVFFTGYDPVASGFVASLSRPGGNATGITVLNTEVMPKRLQMLGELMPDARRIALLHSPTNLVADRDRVGQELQATADALKIELVWVEATRPDQLEGAFTTIANARVDALLASADPFVFAAQATIVDLATRHRIPGLYPIRSFATRGGLASYGTNYSQAFWQVGDYLGRVLNGERPETLPVQQVTKLELVINLRTARAFGLTVPAALIGRADDVIE